MHAFLYYLFGNPFHDFWHALLNGAIYPNWVADLLFTPVVGAITYTIKRTLRKQHEERMKAQLKHQHEVEQSLNRLHAKYEGRKDIN